MIPLHCAALSSVVGLAAFTFTTPTFQPFLSKQVTIPAWLMFCFIYESPIPQFNLNSVQVGLVLFIGPLFYLLTALIVGPVSDALVSSSGRYNVPMAPEHSSF